jgi:hypothetical protein
MVRDLFQADYAKRKPADLLGLAAKLRQLARDTKDDPAARFVLLREAQNLAAQAADPDTALKAIDELASAYRIDALEMKTTALETAVRSATTETPHRHLVATALALVEQAVGADHYPTAARLLRLAWIPMLVY